MRPYKEPLSIERREKLIVGVAAGVPAIYRYFAGDRKLETQKLSSVRTFRRDAPKVGRNEPCVAKWWHVRRLKKGVEAFVATSHSCTTTTWLASGSTALPPARAGAAVLDAPRIEDGALFTACGPCEGRLRSCCAGSTQEFGERWIVATPPARDGRNGQTPDSVWPCPHR
jgi:hypothetical protein